MAEFILNSNLHKINNNTLRFNFKKPVRFVNSNVSLTNMIFYNYFPNVDDNYKILVNHNNETTIVNFTKGAYTVDDISNIINLEINDKYGFKENKIEIIVDVNRYSILIILEEGFSLVLDENFKKLLGFSNGIINESFTRSDLVPNVDKTKYLNIYSNIIDNYNDNNFLSSVYIDSGISSIVNYNESNIHRKQKVYENIFDYIEIIIKNQDNIDIEMKDFFQVSIYISS